MNHPARRLYVNANTGIIPGLEDFLPGDYCGPTIAYTNGVPAVMYMLPITEEDYDKQFGWFGHVAMPPHVFRECPDGSLEIRESILHTRKWKGETLTWHGYLDEGNIWRVV